nr:abc transporter c family member 10 [Quercus suber]
MAVLDSFTCALAFGFWRREIEENEDCFLTGGYYSCFKGSHGIVCALSMSGAILKKEVLIKAALDILSCPGAILLLFCTYKRNMKQVMRILTLSAGPLVLNAFILVADGKESFKYEGYVLAITLIFSNSIEALALRQWYFCCRLIGLKVRSLLTAAIYKKQLRLSNAARLTHSGGEIMNYVTVDAYRIGEFPFWFHQTWITSLQLCIALVILYHAVGLATIASLVVIVLTVLCNAPLAKLQYESQSKLMAAQDERLKASTEALINMKALKLYAWEKHFKNAIINLRKVEYKWLSAVQLQKSYNGFLFWMSPVLVSVATVGACYFLKVPLHANNVFTFVATLRLVQDPIRSILNVIGVVIQAKVALTRILKFLEAPELQSTNIQRKTNVDSVNDTILIKSANFSSEENSSKPTLKNINLEIRPGEKVAICGEVGLGKSTLLAAILGEAPLIQGTTQVYGKIAYVPQTAWIQTGTIQENILFGSEMDSPRHRETLERCSLAKDLELLPYAFSGKTVLLVTHQVDFLPAIDSVLLMSDGEILQAAPYHQFLASSQEFQDLVNAHKETAGSDRLADVTAAQGVGTAARDIRKTYVEQQFKGSNGDQLIKLEEKEIGDTGFRPYLQYLNQNKGFLYFSMASLCHIILVIGQISQNSWMAANVENPNLLNSLFCAPMAFYDSTPLGRILSRVSSDLSIVNLDVPFSFIFAVGATTNAYANLGVLAFVTWQVLFVSIPMLFLAIVLQSAVEARTTALSVSNLWINHSFAEKLWKKGLAFLSISSRFFARNRSSSSKALIVDRIDISMIGLHDLCSRFGIIPQDPTLFNGTVKFNLDPLSQHSDKEICDNVDLKVLEKCQLDEAVKEKETGLDSLVLEDGSNWSQGQRQLFCLGCALLRRSRILVLDEATASIDNATDTILQKTIRTEFADCTVITADHRIPTVMDCTMVLAISDGKIVEYDEPMKLMKREGSLFGQLVKEYWSHLQSAESH